MAKFREYNKLLVFVVTISGLYMPSIENFIANRCVTKFLDIITIIPFGAIVAFEGGVIRHLIYSKDSWLAKTYDLNMIIGGVLLTFKMVYYFIKRQQFEQLFDLWDNSFQEDLFTSRKRKIIETKKKKTDLYIIVFTSISLSGLITWGIPPYFIESKTLPHPSGMDYRHQSPDYEILVTFELITAIYVGVIGLAFDSVLMALLSMEDSQLTHLKRSLAEIVSMVKVSSEGEISMLPDNVMNQLKQVSVHNVNQLEDYHTFEHAEKITEKNTRHIEKKLRVWVKHHQQVIIIHEELRKLVYLPLCMQFANIVIAVCITCFLRAVNALTTIETATFAIYFIGNYSMFYINCKFGDSINETSGSIFEESFSQGWYTYPKSFQSVFHIIIMRAQRPLDIVAFDIYPLGARSFYKIFKTAYTFFTFLLQMMRKRDRYRIRQAQKT